MKLHRVSTALSEKSANLQFKQFYQFGLHVFIFIRNIQTDDSFAIEAGFELLGQFVLVLAFHHENDGRPFNLFAGK
ncbi:hypothetical protein ACUHMQ_17810 [Chitinimonas sp. PSY-7]|uniref:hypothetical protein n=1 Tax=Chitinimonas sp. PSY-7 TaxID=3459088 RepID=UPI00403FE0E9